ncbi:hypothetical protein [Celeribacter sp.]|uniref:hypothetical protein n=1 Tax=Celeribacter sp. TaxID=1890673 RepID=UPI003A932EBD
MSTSKIALLSVLLAGLSACGSPNKSVGPGGASDTLAPRTTVTGLRGTPDDELSANRSIVRLHAAADDEEYKFADAGAVTVNDNGNTLTIHGMPFDGDDDEYIRLVTAENVNGTAGTNGDFYIYRNSESTAPDSGGGSGVDQFDYLAIHQTSADNRAYVTLVASASHNEDSINLDGFVYGRNGGVTMPTENQGRWEGDYAALRTFDEQKRIEYISATMGLDIDFEELGSPGALKFDITDRKLYASDGTLLGDLTPFYAFAENFSIDANGEFQAEGQLGTVLGTVFDDDDGVYVANGELSAGTGTIQGMLAGNNGETIVGTLVLVGGNEITGSAFFDHDDDPATPDVLGYIENSETSGTVNETGAFILDRTK